MTHFTRSFGIALMLAGAALIPAASWAQAQPKTGANTPIDNLTAQEREILALATDLSKRCTDRMERWIANREVTEEKLFSFLYYPIPKTDPPKFSTDWDRLSDRDILPIQEAVLARSPMILYAVMVDKNGYVPTHNQRYSQPLTGNLANDLVNNRTKRIYQDQTGMAAARNEAPFIIQRYMRDTGEILAELAAPLFVRGVRWGSIRIGYRPIDVR